MILKTNKSVAKLWVSMNGKQFKNNVFAPTKKTQKKLVKNNFSFLSEYDEETEAWFFSVLLFSRPSLAV